MVGFVICLAWCLGLEIEWIQIKLGLFIMMRQWCNGDTREHDRMHLARSGVKNEHSTLTPHPPPQGHRVHHHHISVQDISFEWMRLGNMMAMIGATILLLFCCQLPVSWIIIFVSSQTRIHPGEFNDNQLSVFFQTGQRIMFSSQLLFRWYLGIVRPLLSVTA